jgi:hypothetical protein
MGGSRDESHSHASRCAPTHVEAEALADRWSRELYSEHEVSGAPTDAYAVARELGYRKGHNDRTLSCLRELRAALVVETYTAPILFSAEHVEGEWET